MTWELFFQRRSSRSKIENADSEWSPTAIVTFQVFLLFRILKKKNLVHEWRHLLTAFVICPLWSSSNKVFPTCPPAILRASNQHLKCIHMESISTQMYYFPFSVIILHLPKILPILSKKQEGLAKLAALNLCLQNTFKAKAKQTRFQVNCLLSQQPECRLCRSQNAKFKATHFHLNHFHLNINLEAT